VAHCPIRLSRVLQVASGPTYSILVPEAIGSCPIASPFLTASFPRCLRHPSPLRSTRAQCSAFRALASSRQLHPPERLQLGYPPSDLAQSLLVTFALATAACSEHRSCIRVETHPCWPSVHCARVKFVSDCRATIVHVIRSAPW
jgi:hypothetical protein